MSAIFYLQISYIKESPLNICTLPLALALCARQRRRRWPRARGCSSRGRRRPSCPRSRSTAPGRTSRWTSQPGRSSPATMGLFGKLGYKFWLDRQGYNGLFLLKALRGGRIFQCCVGNIFCFILICLKQSSDKTQHVKEYDILSHTWLGAMLGKPNKQSHFWNLMVWHHQISEMTLFIGVSCDSWNIYCTMCVIRPCCFLSDEVEHTTSFCIFLFTLLECKIFTTMEKNFF